MARGRPPIPIVVLIGAVHLSAAALTWRDLARRSDSAVRGSKTLWRAASAANTTGSVAYFLFGRKRT